jgi:hypothetical protein
VNALNYSLNETSVSHSTNEHFCGPFFKYQIQNRELHKQTEGILCFYQKSLNSTLKVHPHEHIDEARLVSIQAMIKHNPSQLPPCLWAVKHPLIDVASLASEDRVSSAIRLSHTDKTTHLLYPIQSYRTVKRVKQACDDINHVMIADGHHRFEAFMRDPELTILPVLLIPLDQLQVRRFYLWARLSKAYITSDTIASILLNKRFQPCAPEQADLFLEWRQQQYPFQWIPVESNQSLKVKDHLAFTELEALVIDAFVLSSKVDHVHHETQDSSIVDQDKLIKVVFKPPCKNSLLQQAVLGEKQPKKSTCFQNKPATNSTQYLYTSMTQSSSEFATDSYLGGF